MLVLDHVSISVPDIEVARPFYDAVMAAHYHNTYFGAFLHDPFGNRVEAVCHRISGSIA